MCKETCGNNKHNNTEEYKGGKYNPLNWPIRARKWCKGLAHIEQFTFWVAIFTLLLFIVAVFQYKAYGHLEKYPFRAACKSDSKNLFEFDHRERVRWGNWVSL